MRLLYAMFGLSESSREAIQWALYDSSHRRIQWTAAGPISTLPHLSAVGLEARARQIGVKFAV